MAKVGAERIFHKGSGKEIYCQINFYTKTKRFVIVDFPEEISEWYGSKLTREDEIGNKLYSGEIWAKSYDECVSIGKRVYSEYYDQAIKEEKIICYQLKTNYPKSEFHGRKDNHDMHFAPALAIGVQYKVMYRITIGDETFISSSCYDEAKNPESGVRLGDPRLNREDGHNGMSDWHKIPYTENYHRFFESVEKGLLSMIQKVNDFFGDSPSFLLEKIETGKLLN
jgi:hypothetical protein